MPNLFEPRQHTEDDVKIAMLSNGVKDVKIWRAYYVHYAAVGWRDGCGRYITNLQLHIGKLKDTGFLAMIRKNEVAADPKPIIKERRGEPVKIASLLERQEIKKEVERKKGLK